MQCSGQDPLMSPVGWAWKGVTIRDDPGSTPQQNFSIVCALSSTCAPDVTAAAAGTRAPDGTATRTPLACCFHSSIPKEETVKSKEG
jgi:hypothetical protein